MIFLRDEKVFSISKTNGIIPYTDINLLFQEFFSYLLITGLFTEGRNPKAVHEISPSIVDASVSLPSSSYSNELDIIISENLKRRLSALLVHMDLTEDERKILLRIDSLFGNDKRSYTLLTGKDFINIGIRRGFSDDMMTIAHYTALAFGQSDFNPPEKLDRLYISIFGNLHLSKDELLTTSAPKLIYNSVVDGCTVTPMWSILSSQIDAIAHFDNPGDILLDMVSSFLFLSNSKLDMGGVPITRYATALCTARLMGIDKDNPVSLSVNAYAELLFGSIGTENSTVEPIRDTILQYLLDLMMEKTDISTKTHLFSDHSPYKKMVYSSSRALNRITSKPSLILEYAIESLDTKDDDIADKEDKDTKLTNESDEDISEDSQTDNNGYDPAATPLSSPSAAPGMDKDNIDLISFDKTGEGISEDLYRTAVVALNDRLQRDDTIDIAAQVKDSLNYWVNGYLYRTAIQVTKEQITNLGLQKYLKNI